MVEADFSGCQATPVRPGPRWNLPADAWRAFLAPFALVARKRALRAGGWGSRDAWRDSGVIRFLSRYPVALQPLPTSKYGRADELPINVRRRRRRLRTKPVRPALTRRRDGHNRHADDARRLAFVVQPLVIVHSRHRRSYNEEHAVRADLDQYERVFGLNVRAMYRMMQAAARGLVRRRREGSIINPRIEEATVA